MQDRLLTEYNMTSAQANVADVRRAVGASSRRPCETGLPLSRNERSEMFEQIVADILGTGPLEQFLRDDSVTEILVNGPRQVFVRRAGILEHAGAVSGQCRRDARDRAHCRRSGGVDEQPNGG